MRVVLVSLNGDEARARAALQDMYADAFIEAVPRASLEQSGLFERVRLIRALRPDVFASSMENVNSQRGQTILSVFAGMTGAKEVVALDRTGSVRRQGRLDVFLRAPLRLVREGWLSAAAVIKSRRTLAQLERAVKSQNHLPASTGGQATPVEFVFLRSTPGPGTQPGGASTHINGFIKAALLEGANVRVVSNDFIAGLDHTKIPFALIPLEGIGITRSAFDLHNNLVFTAGAGTSIAKAPPHFIYQRYSRFTWAGVNARLSFKLPLFLEYNGSEVWVGKHWDDAGMFELLERVERLNLAAADRIFVVSEVERANLLRAGVPEEKIVLNPNGTDIVQFRPGVGGMATRSELGVANNEPLVGFVGTFGPWHGVLELVKAVSMMQGESAVRFLFVGSGKLKDETEHLVKEAGLSDRVIFTGAVAHERVPALLDACDVFMAPHIPLSDGSAFFGSPTKVFEYMAMGKAIVASRLGQIGDVLVDGATALLVEPGNPNELAGAILRLVGSPELRRRLGESARRAAVEKYTWQHNARRVLDAYEHWVLESERHGATE